MVAISHFRPRKTLFLFVICLVGGLLLIFRAVLTRDQEDDPFQDFQEIRLEDKRPVIKFIKPKYLPHTAEPCKVTRPRLLAVVHSSPSHIIHRKAIRQTWGRSGLDQTTNVRIVFAVGRSLVSKIWQRVHQEAKEHGDIILLDMIDSYRNLTFKHLAGLKWALTNCPDVSFILKADDDAFIDVRRALDVLDLSLGAKAQSSDVLACHVMPEGTAPRRSGKWKVTQEEYPYNEYPEYCSGLAYFARPQTMSKLYEAATSGGVPYLWIDDVFVTGLVAAAERLKRVDLGVWYARSEQEIIEWMKDISSNRPCPWMVAEITPRHWPVDAFLFWNKTKHAWKELDEHSIV